MLAQAGREQSPETHRPLLYSVPRRSTLSKAGRSLETWAVRSGHLGVPWACVWDSQLSGDALVLTGGIALMPPVNRITWLS